MIVDQLYTRKINESLADQVMRAAQSAGLNPRLRGTPEQERERTQQMLAQRQQQRDAEAQQAAQDDARNLMALKTEYKQLKDRYEALGGSNWQYADREQNLSDGEREARSMEPALNNLRSRIARAEAVITKESKRNKQRKLNEAKLMEDPIYRNFKRVGKYIAERRMSEKEILQVFADAEAGMTDKATGANRTFLGRGKDTTMDFAGGVANAVKSVLGSIQNSVPVAAVDVAYDQATDALAGLAGGQKGKIMQAIKGYRNLVKQYPKTAGFAKAALVAIAGLATGGASLPAIAGLTYALDSAIKGDKLSSVIGKGAGAAAVTWGGQQIGSMFGNQPGADAAGFDPSQMPAYDDAGNLMPGWHINPEDGSPYWTGKLDPAAGAATGAQTGGADGFAGAETGADTFGGGTYTIEKGDQLGYIAQANGVSVEDIRGINPQIDFSKPLQPGTEIQLPVAGTPGQGSVWQGYQGGMYGDKVAGPELLGGPNAGDFAGATVNTQPTLSFTNGNTGTLSLPDGSQVPVTAFPSDGIQPRLPVGAEAVPVNYAGQDVTAYILNGKAYIKNFSPEQFSNPVQESWLPAVKLRRLPADKLIDQKSTVMNWALSESIGVRSNSINLTGVGVLTVFENVNRYRSAIMELAGMPGSTRPEFYRPDMPGGPGKKSKPGIIGRGLNWLDKAAGKVGGALSNFGHQFTTGVTKEKLKMNWHQAGKPSDSDALAAWLVKQGVPQEVVTSVYGKMGIPYTPAPTVAPKGPADAVQGGGKAERSLPYYGTNPATGKAWTQDELLRRGKEKVDQAAADIPAGPGLPSSVTVTPPAPKPTAQPATASTALPGYNYDSVMQMPGMEKYAKKPAPAKPTGSTGYGKTTMSFKPMTGIPGMKAPATPAAPAAPGAPTTTAKLPAGGGKGLSQAQKDYIAKIGAPNLPESQQLKRVVSALKKPVAEMLNMVESKDDIRQIKQFIDQTFTKYGAVNESAFAVRNALIEHVTQVGAERRRAHARKG